MSILIQLKEKINKLIEFQTKLEALASSEGVEDKAVEVNLAARVISYCGTDIAKLAMEVATLASIKEQSDYAVDLHAQKTENFLSILQNRKPIKIQKKK